MSNKHTPEPWPYFIDWCEPSSPHPDSEGIVRLGFEDYRRARACVNACVGVSNGELAMTTMGAVLSRMNAAEQQRDGLCDAIGLAITIVSELANDENLSGHMKGALTGLAEGLRMRAAAARGEQ